MFWLVRRSCGHRPRSSLSNRRSDEDRLIGHSETEHKRADGPQPSPGRAYKAVAFLFPSHGTLLCAVLLPPRLISILRGLALVQNNREPIGIRPANQSAAGHSRLSRYPCAPWLFLRSPPASRRSAGL
jgi:hypothetical protein